MHKSLSLCIVTATFQWTMNEPIGSIEERTDCMIICFIADINVDQNVDRSRPRSLSMTD